MAIHPATSFGEFVNRHNIGKMPSWSPWDAYLKAGGSTIKESGIWAFTRADIAWFWSKFIKPLQAARNVHRGRLDVHRNRLDSHTSKIDLHTLAIRELEDNIDGLQAQIDAIVIEPGTVDPQARQSAEAAHARLNKYNLN